MAKLTGPPGLKAIRLAGGARHATYVWMKGHPYPPALGHRISETYRQLAEGPMTGEALLHDLAARNWRLPSGRPYRPTEFWKHLRDIVKDGRLHVLTVAAASRPNGIAFKAVYNDGGAKEGLIGYRGVCTPRTTVYNVEVKRAPWCSHRDNACPQFCDRGRKGRRENDPCYESGLLKRKPFKFWTGTYHTGKRSGQPIPIDEGKAAVGDIAFLTTVAPDRPEEDRIVFACYRVGRIGSDDSGNYVESDGTMDLKLPENVAWDCRYWDYQAPNRDGSARWGSGLFRYLDGDATSRFLNDLVWRLGDTKERDTLVNALGDGFEATPPQRGTGWTTRGGQGEGEDHRRLKERIAANPKLVGLPGRSKATLEHSFLSGDRVDVKFDLPNGNAAVVEVETTCPLPGAHQAVKYRALLEVERMEALGSGNVEAILVAHGFDGRTRKVAKSYGIKLFELKA